MADAAVKVASATESLDRSGYWPSLTARGGYTFNETESAFSIQPGPDSPPREITITPHHQFEGSLRVGVTVVDVAFWRRLDVLALRTAAETTTGQATRLATDQRVVEGWHSGLLAHYVRESARSQAETATDRLALAQKRLDAGVAAELDIARARAELARSEGAIASAELKIQRAARQLTTLSGQAVAFDETSKPYSPRGPSVPDPSRAMTLPAVARARADATVARQQADDALMALVPRVELFAEQRFTNGAGFGDTASFLAGVTATFTLDVRSFRVKDERAAQAAWLTERATDAELTARDALLDLGDELDSLRVQLRAAEAEKDAALSAAEVAERRFRDGGGTQLDAMIAQRERFSAEVAVAEARCSLGLAEALLLLAMGEDLVAAGTAGGTP